MSHRAAGTPRAGRLVRVSPLDGRMRSDDGPLVSLEGCGFTVTLERLAERTYAPFIAACSRAHALRSARPATRPLEYWFPRRPSCEYALAAVTT